MFTIRPCFDAALLADLGSRTFYQAYHPFFPVDEMAAYLAKNFIPADIEAELATGTSWFFVLWQGDAPLGYTKLRSDRSHEVVAGRNALEMQRIYLLDEAKGKGAGKVLLVDSENFCKKQGYECMWLAVWQENKDAQAFYLRNGFANRGTAVFKWPNGETHDFVMVKEMA